MNKLATFFGALALVAVAPLARADFSISINGTTCSTGPGNPAAVGGEAGSCGVVVAGGATVTFQETQGTQTSANSQQFTSQLSIIAGSSGATLTIGSAVNAFSEPQTPPNVTDTYTYTLNSTQGSVTASSYTPCVDNANSLTVGAGVCGTPQTLTVAGNESAHSPTGALIITSLGPGDFALNQLVTLTLAANTSVVVTETQILSQVPEPSAILLFGTLLLGVGIVMRRRAAKQA